MKQKITWFVGIVFYTCLIAIIGFACSYNDILVQKNDVKLENMKWHEYDYGVESTDIVAISLMLILFMVITAHLFLRSSKNQKRENIGVVVIPAMTLLSINAFCLLDIVLSSWSVPERCGDGFSIGNCLLLDGLGMIIYNVSVPTLYILAVALFIVNRVLRRKRGKRKKVIQIDDPGLL